LRFIDPVKQREHALLIAAAYCRKKSFTTWTFSSMLIEVSPFPLDRISFSATALTPPQSSTLLQLDLRSVR